MSDPNLAYFERLLIKQRDELLDLADIADEAADTVELDQTRVGRLSRMDALQAQAMSQESRRRRKTELQRIASALSRINEQEYGYCVSCGEEIARNRLKADPAAPLCIDCANRAEMDGAR